MAALYSYAFLHNIDANDIEVPLSRYLHKFEKHRKEITHLKFHEKDFLFRSMKILRNNGGSYSYDLFSIPEAKEFLFDWVILAHANQVMVFDGKIQGPEGRLSKQEIARNRLYFFSYLDVWKKQVESGIGAYFSIIKPALYKKLKELNNWAGEDKRRQQQLLRKRPFIYAMFFHIYYRVKLFFDERPVPSVLKQIGSFYFVFNIYSFVHILSRHYYPDMNNNIEVSLNTQRKCINLNNLPNEIIELIEKRNTLCPITRQTEYLPYSIDGDLYILWIKYKQLNEIKQEGFEVRSFYKCEKECDLDKVKEPGVCVVEINTN